MHDWEKIRTIGASSRVDPCPWRLHPRCGSHERPRGQTRRAHLVDIHHPRRHPCCMTAFVRRIDRVAGHTCIRKKMDDAALPPGHGGEGRDAGQSRGDGGRDERETRQDAIMRELVTGPLRRLFAPQISRYAVRCHGTPCAVLASISRNLFIPCSRGFVLDRNTRMERSILPQGLRSPTMGRRFRHSRSWTSLS